MTPPSVPSLIADLEARIHALVNRGAEICSVPTPNPERTDRCSNCGYALDLHRLRDVLTVLQQQQEELVYWKTCSNCGQQMEAPGLCSVAQHEWQKGQELMYEETLARAEAAEAALRASQQGEEKK